MRKYAKKVILLILCLLIASVSLYQDSYAGEKEEREYEVAYWQEHIRALQFDFELSQGKLKEAILKKQTLEKKIQEESKKTKDEKIN